jgi:acetyl-CoA acyltransferase
MREAVIVAIARSPIGKAVKGKLKDTRPEDIAAQVTQNVLAKVPQVSPEMIDDFVLGCAFPEAEQGMNLGRVVAAMSGLPDSVPGQTINRFCSSGLQSIAIAAGSIISGYTDIVLAGGVESMTVVPLGGYIIAPHPQFIDRAPENYITMGLTAENVAEQYQVSREDQDQFAYESHMKAARAQKEGKFTEEIVPIKARQFKDDHFEEFIFEQDESVRPGLTMADLAKLKPVFKLNGTVTVGNACPTNDGAAIALLMEKSQALTLGLKPIAAIRSFAVAGVPAAIMGIGPIAAIPKALKIAGLSKEDIDLIELNEAFASQALACIRELGLNQEIVNVNGGAIALGHPLGCTGAYLTAKLLHELKRRGGRYGLVSMCIGGGMGAAGVFEML